MPTPVVTRPYDNGRTGANTSETILTPALVASKGLRRVSSFLIPDDPPSRRNRSTFLATS
jgi:hypothetical protein